MISNPPSTHLDTVHTHHFTLLSAFSLHLHHLHLSAAFTANGMVRVFMFDFCIFMERKWEPQNGKGQRSDSDVRSELVALLLFNHLEQGREGFACGL